jgi:hypothetical protein
MPKELLVKEVIDRYPRMLGLLKAADTLLGHTYDCQRKFISDTCVKCQIQALLAEVEQ